MSAFKAEVFIRGCTTQLLYGDKLENLKRRAIKLLHLHEPGYANTYPDKIHLLENLGQIDGNTSRWKLLEVVPAR